MGGGGERIEKVPLICAVKASRWKTHPICSAECRSDVSSKRLKGLSAIFCWYICRFINVFSLLGNVLWLMRVE